MYCKSLKPFLVSRMSNQELVEVYCKISKGEWAAQLGGKPKRWDKRPFVAGTLKEQIQALLYGGDKLKFVAAPMYRIELQLGEKRIEELIDRR